MKEEETGGHALSPRNSICKRSRGTFSLWKEEEASYYLFTTFTTRTSNQLEILLSQAYVLYLTSNKRTFVINMVNHLLKLSHHASLLSYHSVSNSLEDVFLRTARLEVLDQVVCFSYIICMDKTQTRRLIITAKMYHF